MRVLLSISALVKQPESPRNHVLLTVTAWIAEGQLRKDADEWVAKLLELAYQGAVDHRFLILDSGYLMLIRSVSGGRSRAQAANESSGKSSRWKGNIYRTSLYVLY